MTEHSQLRLFSKLYGRITRVDTKHDAQYVKIIELKGSLDTYKRVLMQARIGMINSVFGKQNSMDIQTVNMDKDLQDLMRKAFLWAKDGYMNDDRIKELENNLGVKDENN